MNLEPIQRAELLNNLATCHLYLREPGEARPLFEETLAVLRSDAATKEAWRPPRMASPPAIFQGNLQTAKERYENLLRTGKAKENDTIKAWAHVGLGAIAWREASSRRLRSFLRAPHHSI